MDKIDRLLDVMEHPDIYTPAEIEEMLQDPEVKEVYDTLDKTKSSLQSIATPDVEEEWKRFEEKNCVSDYRRSNRFVRLFSRNAAASIAIAIASVTAVAAIVGVGVRHINNNPEVPAREIEAVSETVGIPAQSDTIRLVEESKVKSVEIIVFDNEPLETILSGIAEYYDCKVAFNNEASKNLRLYFRWDQELTLEDVVERLNNFEQIKLTIKDKTIKVD